MQQYRRRTALGLIGGVIAGGAIASLEVVPATAVTAPEGDQTPAPAAGQLGERFAQNGGDFSWKPQKLDPVEVAAVAHAGFWHQGYACMDCAPCHTGSKAVLDKRQNHP